MVQSRLRALDAQIAQQFLGAAERGFYAVVDRSLCENLESENQAGGEYDGPVFVPLKCGLV